MCGIVAYVGKKEALPILLNGLRRLEYRGYDSAGVALQMGGKIKRVREVGKIEKLVDNRVADQAVVEINVNKNKIEIFGEWKKKFLVFPPETDPNGSLDNLS